MELNINFSQREEEYLRYIANQKGLSEANLLKHALRIYQLVDAREEKDPGFTCRILPGIMPDLVKIKPDFKDFT
jgi:hypothetical protein